jgi:predicted membrane channel-forming protein YqfA (hemolysin III family)
MSSSTLIRMSGLAAMVAGGIWMLVVPGDEALPMLTHAGWHLLIALASVLSLVGLVGLHARQVGSAGRLGWAGFIVALLGAGMVFVGNVAEGGWERDWGWALFMLGMLSLLLGLVLFGSASMRAQVLPRWSVLLLTFSSLLVLLAFASMAALTAIFNLAEPTESSPLILLPIVLVGSFGLGWIVLGYALLRDKAWCGPDEKRSQPSPSVQAG